MAAGCLLDDKVEKLTNDLDDKLVLLAASERKIFRDF